MKELGYMLVQGPLDGDLIGCLWDKGTLIHLLREILDLSGSL